MFSLSLKSLLFISFTSFLFALLFKPSDASCACASTLTECRISPNAQTLCCTGRSCDQKCLVTYGASPDARMCVQAMNTGITCTCTRFWATCNLFGSDFSLGGRCKISTGGIVTIAGICSGLLSAILPIVIILVVKCRVARQAATEYQILQFEPANYGSATTFLPQQSQTQILIPTLSGNAYQSWGATTHQVPPQPQYVYTNPPQYAGAPAQPAYPQQPPQQQQPAYVQQPYAQQTYVYQ